MDFYKWLQKQQGREDRIGAFARAFADIDPGKLKKKSGRRQKDAHKKWANIVTRRGNPRWVMVFNQAWEEYVDMCEEMEAAPA
jgi:hypothetical protein